MNKFLVASCLILMSSPVLAEPVKVKIGGYLDTQAGIRHQKDPFNYSGSDNTKPKLANFGIVNKTRLNVTAEGKMSSGIKYGALIALNADASINPHQDDDRIAEYTMLFIESKYGRLEGGAYDGAPAKMQVSANNIARATGGINGVMQKWIAKKVPNLNYGSLDFGQEFIKWPTLPIDCDFDSNVSKITYYTPILNGFQIGVGYVPDVNRTGTVATMHSIPLTKDPVNAVKGFKDVIEGGIKYTGKFNDYEFETSIIAERSRTAKSGVSRRELLAYEAGALIKYKEFSVAGSYSDWTHSASPKVKTIPGKKYVGGYWTAGIAYDADKYGVSATYFNSQRANLFTGDQSMDNLTDSSNRFEVLSVGADYTVAPGLMPYAEVSFFKTKYHATTVNNRGSVVLIGTKLSF